MSLRGEIERLRAMQEVLDEIRVVREEVAIVIDHVEALRAAAVIETDETGDHLAVRIPIDAWRAFNGGV